MLELADLDSGIPEPLHQVDEGDRCRQRGVGADVMPHVAERQLRAGTHRTLQNGEKILVAGRNVKGRRRPADEVERRTRPITGEVAVIKAADPHEGRRSRRTVLERCEADGITRCGFVRQSGTNAGQNGGDEHIARYFVHLDIRTPPGVLQVISGRNDRHMQTGHLCDFVIVRLEEVLHNAQKQIPPPLTGTNAPQIAAKAVKPTHKGIKAPYRTRTVAFDVSARQEPSYRSGIDKNLIVLSLA